MERRKCCICEGHIVRGRCNICGMPYRSDEELYHLNENRADHYRHTTEAAGKRLRELERPNSGASKAAAGGKRIGKPKSPYAGNAKSGNGGGSVQPKKQLKTAWILLFILIIMLIELWPQIMKGAKELYPFGSFGRDEVSVKTLHEELDLMDMTPKGDYIADAFEGTFGAGEYIIGQQIPRGTYRIELEEGSGEMSFYLNDSTNGLYEFWDFNHEDKGREEYIIEVLENCKLLTDGVLQLRGQGRLRFICEKAYYEDIWEAVENPLKEERQVTDIMEAGVDFEPGTYDLVMKEEGETDTAFVAVESEDGLTETYPMSWEASYGMKKYVNLRLSEGMRISMESAGEYQVFLRSSPVIYEKKD